MNEDEPGSLQARAKAAALMSEIDGRDSEGFGVPSGSGESIAEVSWAASPDDGDAGRSGGMVQKVSV